jgi:integrase
VREGQAPFSTSKPWDEFVAEYDSLVLAGKAKGTRARSLMSLANFKRLVSPGIMDRITTQTIDKFAAARRQEKKQRGGGPISPGTVNSDLRAIKAALRQAAEWKCIRDVLKVKFVREIEKLPRFVPADDFVAIHAAAGTAHLPASLPCSTGEWWRAFLTTAYLTGWRSGELLSLERASIDRNAGQARIWNQKASREEIVPLHPLVIDALAKIRSFDPRALPWPHDRRTLDAEWKRIQSFETTRRHYINPEQRVLSAVEQYRLPALAN